MPAKAARPTVKKHKPSKAHGNIKSWFAKNMKTGDGEESMAPSKVPTSGPDKGPMPPGEFVWTRHNDAPFVQNPRSECPRFARSSTPWMIREPEFTGLVRLVRLGILGILGTLGVHGLVSLVFSA
jgi:hypothetical protein